MLKSDGGSLEILKFEMALGYLEVKFAGWLTLDPCRSLIRP